MLPPCSTIVSNLPDCPLFLFFEELWRNQNTEAAWDQKMYVLTKKMHLQELHRKKLGSFNWRSWFEKQHFETLPLLPQLIAWLFKLNSCSILKLLSAQTSSILQRETLKKIQTEKAENESKSCEAFEMSGAKKLRFFISVFFEFLKMHQIHTVGKDQKVMREFSKWVREL